MWLIRHAESTWNATGRWQGQANPPLSARGRAQAQALAARLAGAGIRQVVSSDLRRAASTAAALATELGIEPEVDVRLRELAAGRWAGCTRAEIEANDGDALARFLSGDADAPVGGGESRRSASQRAGVALRELRAAASGPGDSELAVVTHGGVIGSLFPGTTLGNAEWLELGPGDPIVVDGASR